MSSFTNPPCLTCSHFYVTWDISYPRGCRIFNIKVKNLPSIEVRRVTGLPCPSYQESKKIKK